jgi:arginine-tRNA-protein transferase
VSSLRSALAARGAEPGPEFACSYLPGRSARYLTIAPVPLVPGLYHGLMDLNFRRSGASFYRPQCGACTACRSLRVPVADFEPSRAQRRTLARNADVRVAWSTPQPTEEKRRLFERYLAARHRTGDMSADREEFEGFLYASPLATLEAEYRAGGRLLASAIVDVEPSAWSAVYCYFEPEEPRRSLGVLNVLTLIEACRQRRVDHLYLGYWVEGSPSMAYKDRYRPCEVLQADGSWERRA